MNLFFELTDGNEYSKVFECENFGLIEIKDEDCSDYEVEYDSDGNSIKTAIIEDEEIKFSTYTELGKILEEKFKDKFQ